jgi:hypothetical protein
MTRALVPLAATALVLALAAPLAAHHSFAAQYDSAKPITLKGTVVNLEWTNPHIYVHIDVRDDGGALTRWALEGGAPTSLYRQGWRKDSLKAGDVITVEGFLARDGSKLANMRNVVLADGRRVFGGQNDGGPGGR